MPRKDNSQLKKAAEYWDKGQPLEAGRIVFEYLPTHSRPKWASQILKVVLNRSGIQSSLFDEVLTVAECDSKWKSGHEAFSNLRSSTLKLDELRRGRGLSEDEELLGFILSLAELVAKVTYNASNPTDEFDEDSGWWIPVIMRGFIEHKWKDEAFAEVARSAVLNGIE